MKKFVIIGVVVLTGIIISIVGFGYFPVASVDGSVILYKDVKIISKALDNYRTVVQDREQTFFIDEGVNTRLAFLNELIVNKIILKGSEDFSSEEVEKKVNANLKSALGSASKEKLSEAAEVLYGLSYDSFVKTILEPEAREAVVRDKVEAMGADYEDWLRSKAKTSKVKIYFLPYEWRDGELIEA